MTDLRDYQGRVVDEVEQRVEQGEDPCVVAPCGSGKTVIASAIIRRAKDKHVLFLAHRRELIHQAANKLADFGVNAGIVLAGVEMNQMAGVQVGSIQTVFRRCLRGSTALPPADLIFVDEAHHTPARSYREILAANPDACIIGLTATPCRTDGHGLGGDLFDAIVECPQVEQLIQMGFLARTRVFAPSTPDLKGVRTQAGDYVTSQLADRVDRPKLVGDIVSSWHRLGEGRQTLVYGTNVDHSIHLRDEFEKSGVKAAHIDGKTDKTERDEIIARYASGDITVVTNCQIFCEGYDAPETGCIVLARPTKSAGLFRQMVGRGQRPAPGKADCIVLDHAGAVFAHGLIEDPVVWTLSEGKKALNPAQATRAMSPGERALVACPKCSAIRSAGKPCPQCGHMPKRPGQFLETGKGELSLYRNGKVHPQEWPPEVKADWHAQLAWIAHERGYKAGWAAHKFREKFGNWPRDHVTIPKQPSGEVLSWERSRRIAYAKAREKAGAYHG
jgi:DNA repair protein RadD